VIQILKKAAKLASEAEARRREAWAGLTKDQMITEKSKHIDIRYHFIRDIIEKGLVKVCKISTDNNPADMMTKHVSVAKFELCSNLVGIIN
jgi:hypothetical protein